MMTFSADAQVQDSIPSRPKVGLVLSGGAAHGLAHIGVIEALEDLNIPIDYISGSSMGSIVGALKAMGYTAQEMRGIALNLDWDALLTYEHTLNKVAYVDKYYHDKYPLKLSVNDEGDIALPFGLKDSYRIDMMLKRVFYPASKVENFHDLPIPFQCYTLDIVSGKTLIKSSGNLDRALRASMAIPAYFAPVKEGRSIYIDGGVETNFPVEGTIDMGADVIIGSYVGAKKKEFEEINSVTDILTQTGFLLSMKDYERQKKKVDVLIVPNVKNSSSLDFSFDEFNVNMGYNDTMRKKKELIKLRDSLNLSSQKSVRRLDYSDEITIGKVIVKTEDEETDKYLNDVVLGILDIQLNEPIPFEKLEKSINNLKASGEFSSINFQTERYSTNKDRYKLILDLKLNESVMIGGALNRFETTGPSAIIQLHAKNKIARFADLKLTGRLSETPAIGLSLYQRGEVFGLSGPVIGLNAYIENSNYGLYSKGKNISNYLLDEFKILPYMSWSIGNNFSAIAQYSYQYAVINNKTKVSDNLIKYKQRNQSVSFNIVLNTLDEEVLPRKGIYFNLGGDYNLERNVSFRKSTNEELNAFITKNYNSDKGFFGLQFDLLHAVPLTKHIGLRYHIKSKIKTNNGLLNNDRIGGTLQFKGDRVPFVGMQESEIQSSFYYLLRGELTYDIDRFQIAAIVNSIGYERQPVITTNVDYVNQLAAGMALRVKLPTGPLQLEGGWNTNNKDFKVNWSLGYRHLF